MHTGKQKMNCNSVNGMHIFQPTRNSSKPFFAWGEAESQCQLSMIPYMTRNFGNMQKEEGSSEAWSRRWIKKKKRILGTIFKTVAAHKFILLSHPRRLETSEVIT